MGFVKGVALGALAMYFLDPERAEQRRQDLLESVEDAASRTLAGVESAVQRIPPRSRLCAASGLIALGVARRGWLGSALAGGGLTVLALLGRSEGETPQKDTARSARSNDHARRARVNA